MFFKIPVDLEYEANSSEHRMVKAKRHRLQKALVKKYLKRETLPELPCVVTLTRHAPRKYDFDNLEVAFKYYRDQISESLTNTTRAGRADSDPRIIWVYKWVQTKDAEIFITVDISQNMKTEEDKVCESAEVLALLQKKFPGFDIPKMSHTERLKLLLGML